MLLTQRKERPCTQTREPRSRRSTRGRADPRQGLPQLSRAPTYPRTIRPIRDHSPLCHGHPPGLDRRPNGYLRIMMKSLIFLGGAAAGFAACSFMSEEQRERVRAKTQSLTENPRARRLQSAARDATGSVADVAVTAVEGAADRVSSAAGDVSSKLNSGDQASKPNSSDMSSTLNSGNQSGQLSSP